MSVPNFSTIGQSAAEL